jgi:quercetin dioxygenase-like cupin family protein
MIPEDVEALALADAVGLLEPDEQRDLQQRVAALAPDGRAEVARLYDVAVNIGSAVEQDPPPRVREKLLAAISGPTRYSITAQEGEWKDTGLPGIRSKILSVDNLRGLVTMLVQGEPGAIYPPHHHSGPEECYVIRGSVVIDGRLHRAGDFHHADPDSDHGPLITYEGTEVLIVGAIADYLPH